MPDKSALLGAARGYLSRHPEEVLRIAKNAVGLRFGLPLAALRFLAAQGAGKKGAPKDVQIEAVPPGIRVGATVDLMGNSVRASATVFIERVSLNTDELRFEVRLADVSLKLLEGAPDSPVAALLQSGALDLSKPGNLAAYMPKRPAVLVEAKDDRIVIDLMKDPKLQRKEVQRILGIVTPLLSVRGIQTDWEHLDVLLQAFPDGVSEAMHAVRRHL